MNPRLLGFASLALAGTLAPALAPSVAVGAGAPDFSRVDAVMQQVVATVPLPGASLIVVKDGAAIFQQHYGSYSANTRRPVASVSKWVSAMVIGSVVDSGLLRWDSTIGEWFPQARPDQQAITLRQLFSHTAGFSGESNPCITDPTTTLEACAAQILAMPLSYAPGTCFDYAGNSMQVAGRMVELAAGQAWDDLFIARVVQPLGLVATDYANTSLQPGYVRNTNPRIDGGVRSRANEIVRIAQVFVQRGQFGGQQVLSAATVDFMRADQTGGVPYAQTPDPLSYGYGIGLWRNRLDQHGTAVVGSSAGALGTWPWFDTAAGVAAVFFTQDRRERIESAARALVREVNAAVLFGDPVHADGLEGQPMRAGCAVR